MKKVSFLSLTLSICLFLIICFISPNVNASYPVFRENTEKNIIINFKGYDYDSPLYVQVMDMNDDNKLDIIVGTKNRIIILLQKNNCTFNLPADIVLYSDWVDYFQLVDINNDNLIDILTDTDFFYQQSNGNFSVTNSLNNLIIDYQSITNIYSQGSYLDDYNNDGYLDYIFFYYDTNTLLSYIAIHYQENGQFLSEPDLLLQTGAYYLENKYTILIPHTNLYDFNDDGRLDIVGVIFQTAKLFFKFQQSDGSFTYPEIIDTNLIVQNVTNDEVNYIGGIKIADLNHDGFVDIIFRVSSLYYNQNHVLYRSVDGTFHDDININRSFPPGMILCDLNDDDLTDILDYTTGYILYQLDNHSFLSGFTYEPGFSSTNAAVADINEDGLKDIVIVNGANWDFQNCIKVFFQNTKNDDENNNTVDDESPNDTINDNSNGNVSNNTPGFEFIIVLCSIFIFLHILKKIN